MTKTGEQPTSESIIKRIRGRLTRLEFHGSAEELDLVTEELSKLRADLLKSRQLSTSLHIALEQCRPYILDLNKENVHEPNVGLFKDRDLEQVADKLVNLISPDYANSLELENNQFYAALARIQNDIQSDDYQGSTISGATFSIIEELLNRRV